MNHAFKRTRAFALRRVIGKPWSAFWALLRRLAYEGRPYTLQLPYGHRAYTPWFAPESEQPQFRQRLQIAQSSGQYIWNADRSYGLHQFCSSCLGLGGDMAECGVYAGGTAHLMSLALTDQPQPPTLHLFDTFQGMPPRTGPLERSPLPPGDFAADLSSVQRRLRDFPFLRVHEGEIPGTFARVAAGVTFGFVHVNVSNYQGTLDCCQWFWPRLQPGGMIMVSDYGLYALRHATRPALDEFSAAVGVSPIVLSSGIALIVKR